MVRYCSTAFTLHYLQYFAHFPNNYPSPKLPPATRQTTSNKRHKRLNINTPSGGGMEAMKAVCLPQYLNMSDLCEMLKVNRSTIYRQVEEGLFPRPIKLGKCRRWLYSEVIDFLNQQQQAKEED